MLKLIQERDSDIAGLQGVKRTTFLEIRVSCVSKGKFIVTCWLQQNLKT